MKDKVVTVRVREDMVKLVNEVAAQRERTLAVSYEDEELF